jgi:YidC/Oxa1 family membrane protein insertase
MEKRILFAFLLSIAVMYTFRVWMAPKTTIPQTAPVPQATPATPPTAPPSPLPATTTGETAAAASFGSDQEIRAEKYEEVLVDTELYTATVANSGAILKSFRLKKYMDTQGNPIELIDAAGASKNGWPLATATQDPKLDEVLSSSNYSVVRDGNRVTTEFASAGVHTRKVLNFDPENYAFSVEVAVTRDSKPVPSSIVWQGGFGDQSISPEPARRFVVYPNNTSYKTTSIASIKEPQEMTVNRIGVEDQYFLAMFLLPGNASIHIGKQEYPGSDGKAVATSALSIPSLDAPMRVYVGPKDPNWLKKTDPSLAGVIDYGWLEFIAKPLTVALLWMNTYIGNFGWAIIILTVAINLVLFPLRVKQQVSMQKMQRLQPQMKTLQDKYKKLKTNDPKRVEVQSQMMNLYKEHGVNPMSGCLPLLLQMPFLYAIYKMLAVTIELRQAPWLLWITDLSQPDRLHIMPLLMAGTMILQQKTTPTAVDPAQARMMMIMPLMLVFLFWSSQSGLMLYWLTSNVVGIGQQFFINKYWGPAAPVAQKK